MVGLPDAHLLPYHFCQMSAPSQWDRSTPSFSKEYRALAKLHTFTLVGIDAILIDVEVDVTPSGLPQVILVGLAETAVKESIHRVDRAITNSAYQRPGSRCVINLCAW